jgi:hypothetical protein
MELKDSLFCDSALNEPLVCHMCICKKNNMNSDYEDKNNLS